MRFAIKKNTYGRGLYFHNISYSKTRESLEENLNIDQSLGISAAFYILLNFNRVTIILWKHEIKKGVFFFFKPCNMFLFVFYFVMCKAH